MRRLKILFNPIITLVAVQLVWIGLVVLWVLWFVGQHNELRGLAEKYRPELVSDHINWPVLLVGIFLLSLILIGFYIIFIYWKKQSRLYAEQKSFISQITHELKSPLASIRLHLETIRMRRLPPEKVDRFLDTMLADTERLNSLISNFLMAAKLEQKVAAPIVTNVDLSALVIKVADACKEHVPEGALLAVDVEPGIIIKGESEGLEMAVRNLLENAFLYSSPSPEVQLSLQRSGRGCLLAVSDNGRGLDRREFERIFRMFYRVRTSGETIRGTGLGLYIVRSVVVRHQGKVSVESGGAGKGTRFAITFPMVEVN